MTLESWLEQATQKLSAESAARVRSEIQEHYTSAQEGGRSPEEAVASLGSPREANQRYLSVLISAREDRLLQFWRQPQANSGALLLAGSALLGPVVLAAKAQGPERAAYAGSLLVALILGWFSLRMMKPPLSRTGAWFLRAMPVFSALAAVVAFQTFGFDNNLTRFWTSSALSTLVMGASLTWAFLTPDRAKIFRPLKWAILLLSSLILFWPLLVQMPWILLLGLFVFIGNEWNRISLRRKLPVAEWPPQLYR